MRLTSDIIVNARVLYNPLQERELDLRGYKIPAIENLGATNDQFDCFDMSDNEIIKLEGFPKLRRLSMLLLINNHISRIQKNLCDTIENMNLINLSKNKITNFTELNNLACLKNLDTLILVGNPITRRRHYREFVIKNFPQVKVLDYQKVKLKERQEVEMLFKSAKGKQVEAELMKKVTAASLMRTLPKERSAVVPPPPPPAPPASAPTLNESPVKSRAAGTAPETSAEENTENSVPSPPTAPVVETSKPAEDVQSSKPAEVEESSVADAMPESPCKKATDGEVEPESNTTQMDVDEQDKETETPEPADGSPFSTPTKKGKKPVEAEDAMEVEDEMDESSSIPPPETPVSKMKVAELREELKKRGLPTKGLKAALVSRLKEAL